MIYQVILTNPLLYNIHKLLNKSIDVLLLMHQSLINSIVTQQLVTFSMIFQLELYTTISALVILHTSGNLFRTQ